MKVTIMTWYRGSDGGTLVCPFEGELTQEQQEQIMRGFGVQKRDDSDREDDVGFVVCDVFSPDSNDAELVEAFP